jgi:hypothetical protein
VWEKYMGHISPSSSFFVLEFIPPNATEQDNKPHPSPFSQCTQNKKTYDNRGMIKSVTQHSYFEKKPSKEMSRLQNNPSIGWVHPKSTHACPLAWGNKKT